MIGKTEWPHILADLRAKRGALDSIITTIETHFVVANGPEMPDSPIAAPAPGPRPRRKYTPRTPAKLNGRRAKKNGRTDGRTEQSPRQRSLPDGAQEPP